MGKTPQGKCMKSLLTFSKECCFITATRSPHKLKMYVPLPSKGCCFIPGLSLCIVLQQSGTQQHSLLWLNEYSRGCLFKSLLLSNLGRLGRYSRRLKSNNRKSSYLGQFPTSILRDSTEAPWTMPQSSQALAKVHQEVNSSTVTKVLYSQVLR